MKITAFIPIRKGSQRVKHKNIRPFCDTTLLEWKLDNLLKVPEFNNIVVNTNSEIAMDIVKNKYKGRVELQIREEYYASSECTGSEVQKYYAEVTDTDLFVYTPCTSPFIKAETISKCIHTYLDNPDCDCVATVSSVKEFLWLNNKAINYNPAAAVNSQDLPDIVALNYGTCVLKRSDLIKFGNFIGTHPLFIETDDIESIDIDNPIDFFLAEQIYKKIIIEKQALIDNYEI